MKDDSSSSSDSSTSIDMENFKSQLVATFLNLEKVDKHLFRSTHLISGRVNDKRVYGGLVIGQALVAAGKTVPPEFHAHSLHCYFIQAGDKNFPIVYRVKPVRDGRSFYTRFVEAVQEGEAIFSCQVSFQKEERASIKHQATMPNVPKPEQLKDAADVLRAACERKDVNEEQRRFFRERLQHMPTTFDLRPTDEDAFLRLKTAQPHYYMWVKSSGPIGDEIRLHHCVAAFISDSTMINTALLPHLASGFRLGMAVSLDHTMWFHRYNFNIENWMLYETESTVAEGGRALIHGRLWTTDGVLAVSTYQEALIREKHLVRLTSESVSSSDSTTLDIPSLIFDEMVKEYFSQDPPLPAFSPYFPIDFDVFPQFALQSQNSGRVLNTSEESIRVQQLEDETDEDRTLMMVDDDEPKSEEVVVDEVDEAAAAVTLGDLDKRDLIP